ncbi:MAG: hypothetical protein A2Y25_07315 [Candidatus Melainabacteria bacterium GWF2_37_15]|nr:MAG: hypothetical protein A2Y25_07315 [Candidatus Melainabacteria bacterium GWF2_37_15]
MFTKEQLLEKINDPEMGSASEITNVLKSWRIDPIYEDENKNEYYDEMAISKLKHALKLKEQGKNDEEISSIVNNGIINPITAPMARNTQAQALNNITLDVTSQTLSLLAESIAQKITGEITEKLKNSDIFEPLMDSTRLKRDNEILSRQVSQILEENKKLITRNNMLQKENAKFRHLAGQLYFKQQ